MRCALVVTTINNLVVLDAYFDNFSKYGRLDECWVIIIPDKKTPKDAFEKCRELSQKGMQIIWMDLDDQVQFLASLGLPEYFIPYNSDNRRNVGFLKALEMNVDFLISIDDDNYALLDFDFIAEHSVVAIPPQEYEIVHSSSGWFNLMELLRIKPDYQVYPRGYPYNMRHVVYSLSTEVKHAQIRLNTGLWLGDPDVDGITWLAAPTQVTGFKERSVVLGEGTWTPINTQNTALHRDVIPAYYFVKMGYPIEGMVIERYGDIFSGYFVQACIRHMGHFVRAGSPIVEHRRNAHHYLRDATSELGCIWVLEDLTQWLTEIRLSGNTYLEAYNALSYALEDFVESVKGFIWTDSTRGYFHSMAYYQRKWLQACKAILGR